MNFGGGEGGREMGGNVLADDSPRDLTCPGNRTFPISAIMMAGPTQFNEGGEEAVSSLPPPSAREALRDMRRLDGVVVVVVYFRGVWGL